MRWSVSLVAEGDRVIALEEVVELADAVAGHQGVATGMGTMSYGAQIIVDAATSEEAIELAVKSFKTAVLQAGLPSWPIADVEAVGDEEEMDWYEDIPEGRGISDVDRP